MAEPQGDQSAQIDRRGTVVQPVAIFDDAAVTHLAVAAGQPGDAAFDHRSVLTIFVEPVHVSGCCACVALQLVVGPYGQRLALGAGGASLAQATSPACRPERDHPGGTDGAAQPGRTRRRAVGVVDGEVIDGEPARHRRARGCGLDPIAVAGIDEFGTQFPGAIGGIGEHRECFGFTGEQIDPDRGVILSYALDGRDRQVVATGLHQPAALAIFRGDVWFTDIMPADDVQYPHDEVNRLVVGADYGYPTCANECEPPLIPIARGYAPVALLAYEGDAFPNLEGQLLALLAGAERTAQLRGPDLVGFDLEPERIIAEALFPYDPTVYVDTPFAINMDTGYINPATNYLNQRGAGFWPQRLYGLAINTQGWMVFSVSDGRLMALRPR